ncbi:BTB/POZ domain-containing adapter for CUL3-mediated RhoA degradation protein 3-like [Brevipalpus obovatus]|uniref:BTB/POZ domain-containing adapter for CUL3-mediated RhoA degradation protein 3-like n=1 Tax=Brevipalpus obovatus TaxID=246614 RepID=UPI003D9E47A7
MASNSSTVSVMESHHRPGEYIKLNVGGSLFQATRGTLTRYGSIIKKMLSEESTKRIDAEGYMLIDRSGKHFGNILNFLRDGSIPLPHTEMELEELLLEAKFYQIRELIDRIERKISFLKKPSRDQILAELAEKVIVFTSFDDENDSEKLTKLLSKMTGLLLKTNRYIRSGSSSQMNLLRNLELFEFLFKEYGRKLIFLKDSESSDYCKWWVIEDGKCTRIISCDDGYEIQYKSEEVLRELSNIIKNHFMN